MYLKFELVSIYSNEQLFAFHLTPKVFIYDIKNLLYDQNTKNLDFPQKMLIFGEKCRVRIWQQIGNRFLKLRNIRNLLYDRNTKNCDFLQKTQIFHHDGSGFGN
jgi:hypothetical protein